MKTEPAIIAASAKLNPGLARVSSLSSSSFLLFRAAAAGRAAAGRATAVRTARGLRERARVVWCGVV